jgi:hypothetical protein
MAFLGFLGGGAAVSALEQSVEQCRDGYAVSRRALTDIGGRFSVDLDLCRRLGGAGGGLSRREGEHHWFEETPVAHDAARGTLGPRRL